MTKRKKYKTQQNSLKAKDNPKILKEYSPLLHLEKTQHKELSNARKKRCYIILERKSNIKITENKILDVSKHLYECSLGKFKIMLIYQTNGNTLLQIKEKISLIN